MAKKQTPWWIPTKWYGDKPRVYNQYWDEHFMGAAQQIADEESAKYDRLITAPHIIQTLVTRRGPEYTAFHRRHQSIMKQLKKEDTHHVNPTPIQARVQKAARHHEPPVR